MVVLTRRAWVVQTRRRSVKSARTARLVGMYRSQVYECLFRGQLYVVQKGAVPGGRA